ncbi:cubilin-like isoform X2 [Ornithodoros turicata]|uniref:cubilin-like isoform X2 n=1 Tax=Ornithodoros turicata TaxID=34597 RepID=UPI003138DDB5
MRLCLQRTVVLCLVWIFYGGLAQNDTRQFYQGSDLEDFTSSHCDATIQTLEDWIFTPNYPSDYDSFRTCTFTVRKVSTDICTLLLTFNDFDVEDSDGCANDYLLLPDGQRLCGALPPDTTKQVSISRRHSKFTFIFSSNEAYTAKGFMIKVTQLTHTCTDDVPDSPLYPPDSESAEFPLATDKHSPIESGHCNRDILGYSHVLTSPGYPYGYSNYERCTYRVWRADSSVCVVELDIQDFTLNPEDYRGCLRDYLELPDNSRLCGVVSGTKLLEFSPGSDTLTMTFVSDAFGSGRGFSIHLRQRRNSCGFGPTGGCDQRLLGSSGIIRSPNYPRFYGPNQRCRYTVVRLNPFVCRVEFTFKRFNLETSYGCRKDYVELPDRSRLCGRYTGTKVFEFNQDAMNLYFVSDSYVANSGFEIEVHQLINSCLERAPTQGCDKTVTRERDFLRSPEYPKDYPSNAHCVYTIRRSRPSICRVRLDLVHFDLEDGSRCDSDALIIENTGERICGYKTGTSKTVQFPIGADEIRFIFSSDPTTTRKGFDIRVTQESNCNRAPLSPSNSVLPYGTCGRLRSAAGRLDSPRYPAFYPPNLDCNYWIHKSSPEVCRAQLYFTRFDLGTYLGGRCPFDFLDIQGTKYCGRRDGQALIVDFPYKRDTIVLRLHTDHTSQKSGFRIQVRQMTTGCARSLQPQSSPRVSCNQVFTTEEFQIVSLGFRRGGYLPNTDCAYVIKKSDFRVCALEIKIDAFDLEDDADCDKDYLQFNEVKLCGKQAYGATRTIEFLDDELKVHFHSNPTINGAGFFVSAKQVSC